MEYIKDDGGRAEAGFKGKGGVGDCVTRAIVLAGGYDYREVYDELAERREVWVEKSRSRVARREAASKKPKRTASHGMPHPVWKRYLEERGWTKQSVMGIGTGTRMWSDETLPATGTYIVQTRRHLIAVVDGVLRDTWDSRGRGVYSLWWPPGVTPPELEEAEAAKPEPTPERVGCENCGSMVIPEHGRHPGDTFCPRCLECIEVAA